MGTTGLDWLAQAGAQSYREAVAHKQRWDDAHRQQAIADAQTASLGIIHALNAGVRPDTGEQLSAGERLQLVQRHREIQGQLTDLWNLRQSVDEMGKNQSAASGVAMPEGVFHKLGDRLHLTKPPAPGVRQTTTSQTPEMNLPGGGVIPAGPSTAVQGPPKSPAQQMAELREISQKYRPQPGQAEAESAEYQLQSRLRHIEADPELTTEEKADARRKVYGVSERPQLKLYTLPDGTRQWLDVSRPDLIPDGATASVPETADTRSRSDFTAFQKQHPEYKGTFEQWKTEQGATGRAAAPTPGSAAWFDALPANQQKTFLENKRKLAIAAQPYGAMNAETNRLRLGVSQEAVEIAKDRLLFGTETGNITNLKKSASTLEETAQIAEARLRNPTPIGDTGIVMEWVKSQIAGAGRMNNVELEQALSSGTLNQQISNKLGRRFDGTLDASFRSQMVKDIRMSADVAKKLAGSALGQYQQDVSENLTSGAPSGKAPAKNAKGIKYTVRTPDGQTFTFPNALKLDMFKKEAGLK